MPWRPGGTTEGRPRRGGRPRLAAKLAGLALASLLLVAACGEREKIVYVDRADAHGGGTAASTSIGRSDSPRVHADGRHEPAPEVEIGGPGGVPDEPYVPIAAAGSLLLVPGSGYAPAPAVLIGLERAPGGAGAGAGYAATPTAIVSGPAAKPGVGSASAPRPAASPTAPASLALGARLGAQPSASGAAPAGDMLVVGDEDDEPGTVSGRIESAVGPTLIVRTDAGPVRVQLEGGARIERDTPGTAADLKPGQFVGALQVPGGPALSIRLYNTGPSMPPPGIVPMVGSRVGQVTTFGTIVALQFGGLLLNTASQTTAVTLPNNVEILKPAPGTLADAGVGAQIIATGPLASDGSVRATAIRVTAAAPRVAPAASPQPPAPRRS